MKENKSGCFFSEHSVNSRLIHSFILILIFAHSFVCSCYQLFSIHSYIYLFIRSFVYIFICSL